MPGGQGPPQQRRANLAQRAERRERALRLAIAGKTYAQIAEISAEWAYGYNSPQAAHADVKRALEQYRAKQDLAAADLIAKQELLLGEAIAVAHQIMNTTHLAHGNGRIVRREIEHPDGTVTLEDVHDDGPRLQAALALTRISESYRKLKGLDAPAKIQGQVDGTINYVINTSPEELEQL